MENISQIRYITKEDLLNNGCNDMQEAMNIIEKVIMDYEQGKILLPTKISQIFNETSQDRINCMPATLLNEKICGVKWVSVFPNNPINHKLPNINGVIILSNIENGLPIAFMDGTLCTNLRTAAVGGVATKYLACEESETIGFIGPGEQAKNHLIAMKLVLPKLKICKVAAKYKDSEIKFVQDMKEKFPDIKFIQCNANYEMAVRDADVIVTATSGQDPILQANWIKKGAFYCHVGGLEDKYEVAQLADKIVCDDWEAVKHRKQTISIMYQKGLLKDTDIYANLIDLIKNKKVGREKKEEFIYFNSVGLSYIDIAIANEMYKKCIKNNVGVMLNL